MSRVNAKLTLSRTNEEITVSASLTTDAQVSYVNVHKKLYDRHVDARAALRRDDGCRAG